MIVRKIKEQDIESVSSLMARNFDEIMSRYHSKHIIEKFKNHNTPEKVRTQMQWKEIFVVEEDNEIIATGALANFGDMENPKYSVSNFFVKPELHNRGIGKLLFRKILDTAKGKGAEVLHVPSSRNAVAFYEKIKFVQDEILNDTEDEITWMTMKVK
ncbi:MAG: GNAT family N-acetyltransferase [Ruminiclostridium sp.]|nr:GNAT family N-acetyltransferase [Ruminiclostridium sp.]